MSKSAYKTGILLAAFGSSSVLGEKALGHFAQRVRQVYPALPVRWAYTSGRMRSRLAEAGKKTDSVKKALCRMAFERYSHVAVQSLHLIPGVEYEALIEESEAARAAGGPARVSVGSPLLHDEGDVEQAASALLAHLPAERRMDEAVVCVGHGTWHSGAASYAALSERLTGVDPLIFIGTLSGEHSIDALLPVVAQSLGARRKAGAGPQKVWLLPLLSIIGKHAEQDMAGAGALSWRGRFEAAGFCCCPVLTGTVEYEAFAAIWLAHLGEALKKLRDF